jgi:ubiquinone/menaquinone biosynthesis C-methylase UbiE
MTKMADEKPVETAGHTIEWARWYDAFVHIATLGRARKIREKTISLAGVAPGEDVLDVGCGPGDLTMLARKWSGSAGRISGIDPSSEMIRVARSKAGRKALEIEYVVAAAEALPFDDSTFDQVLSSFMMHHLPEALRGQVLAEVHRVLRPGGRLLVVDLKRPTGHQSHFAPLSFLHRRMQHGVEDLSPMLQAAGFTSVEAGDVGFGPVSFVRGVV